MLTDVYFLASILVFPLFLAVVPLLILAPSVVLVAETIWSPVQILGLQLHVSATSLAPPHHLSDGLHTPGILLQTHALHVFLHYNMQIKRNHNQAEVK